MRLLYFSWVRERIGVGEEEVDPPAAVQTVRDLVEWLKHSSAAHGNALVDVDKLRAAVDQRFVPIDAMLGDATEVALFPPVTGG